MRHALRKTALLVVRDTPLERFARRVYSTFSTGEGSRYDRETIKVMRRVLDEESTCIDVGAYRGDMLSEMLRIVRKGAVFAFEPIPENYRYLTKKYGRARVFNVALADWVGQGVFYHVLGRPARSGLEKQEYPDPAEDVRQIKVAVDTLDRTLPRQGGVDLIKIDVEGAELLVLRGGEQTIKEHKPVIVFEHDPRTAESFGTTSAELYDFLSCTCAMRISLMARWLEGGQPYTREAFLKAAGSGNELYFIAY